MLKKIKSLFLLFILAFYLFPVSAFATGGLLSGLIGTVYNANGTVYASNLTAATDGDNSTYVELPPNAYFQVVLPRAKSVNLTNLNSSTFYAPDLKFVLLNPSMLSLITIPTNVVAYSFTAVDNVSYIKITNNSTGAKRIYEVDIFEAPPPPDTTAPPIPTNLAATSVTHDSVTLNWDDNSRSEADFKGWNIYRNGVKVASLLTANTYTVTGQEDNTTYTFNVTSVDASGNESAASNTVYTLNDTISPLAPIGLAVNGKESDIGSSDSATLTWTPNDEQDMSGYNVYANLVKNNDFLITLTSYTAKNLSANVTYQFQVTAVDNSGNESEKSAAVTYIYDTMPPAKPSGLTATPGNKEVSLSWDQNTDDTEKYHIYMNGSYVNTVLQPTTNFLVTGLQEYTTYSFTIVAEDAHNNTSSDSDAVTARTLKTSASAAPTGLYSVPGDGKATLHWNLVEDVSSYNVYKKTVLFTWAKLNEQPVTGNTFEITGLDNGSTYTYAVTSVDPVGNESDRSAPISVTPQGPPPPAPGTGIVYDSSKLGFSASDIFTNSVAIFGFISAFVLLGIVLNRTTPKVFELVRKAFK